MTAGTPSEVGQEGSLRQGLVASDSGAAVADERDDVAGGDGSSSGCEAQPTNRGASHLRATPRRPLSLPLHCAPAAEARGTTTPCEFLFISLLPSLSLLIN